MTIFKLELRTQASKLLEIGRNSDMSEGGQQVNKVDDDEDIKPYCTNGQADL